MLDRLDDFLLAQSCTLHGRLFFDEDIVREALCEPRFLTLQLSADEWLKVPVGSDLLVETPDGRLIFSRATRGECRGILARGHL